MKVTFLGTSCMMPTKERNHPGFLLSYKNENILVDCGENIQRQIKVAGMSPTKITKILLSHWHGDHVFGLPGLLQSLIGHQYHGVLEIYGPKGTKRNFEKMCEAFPLRGDLQRGKNVKFNGKTIKSKDVTYAVKGKKITFVLDTYINDNCYKIAKNS